MYLFFKSLHIFAAIVWVGSLVAVSFISQNSRMSSDQINSAMRITEASIGITWLMGIILAIMGSWYASTWWHIKVALVVLLSTIHTFIHRRWKNAGVLGAETHNAAPFFILILGFLIVLLATYKQPL